MLLNLNKIIKVILCSIIAGHFSLFAQDDCEADRVLNNYKMFSEYHRAKDYYSAIPFGWMVLYCNKTTYAKWIYYKMEECLLSVHDSKNIPKEEIRTIEDNIVVLYNMAIKYYPDANEHFSNRKAYFTKKYLGSNETNSPTNLENSTYRDIYPNIFAGYKQPIGVGILQFEGSNDLHSRLYDELKTQPGIHDKFAIFPYDVLEQQRGVLGIEGEMTPYNVKALKLLKDNLEIELVVSGSYKSSSEFDMKIYNCSEGKQLFEGYYKRSENSIPMKDAVKLFSDYKETIYKTKIFEQKEITQTSKKNTNEFQRSEMLIENIGLTISNFSDSDKSNFDSENGVLITNVTPNGRAEDQRLFKGLIIVEANKQKLFSVEQFLDILKSKKGSAL